MFPPLCPPSGCSRTRSTEWINQSIDSKLGSAILGKMRAREPWKASTHVTSPIHTLNHRAVRDAGLEPQTRRWSSPETGRNWGHSHVNCCQLHHLPRLLTSPLLPWSSPHHFLSKCLFSSSLCSCLAPDTQKKEGKKSMLADSLPLLSGPTKNLENCTFSSSVGGILGLQDTGMQCRATPQARTRCNKKLQFGTLIFWKDRWWKLSMGVWNKDTVREKNRQKIDCFSKLFPCAYLIIK